MLGDFLIPWLSQDLFLPSSPLAFTCHLGVSACWHLEEGLLRRGVLTPRTGAGPGEHVGWGPTWILNYFWPQNPWQSAAGRCFVNLFPSAVRELASRTLSKSTRQGAGGVGGAYGLEHPDEHGSICSGRKLSVLRTAAGGWPWFTATEQRQATLH